MRLCGAANLLLAAWALVAISALSSSSASARAGAASSMAATSGSVLGRRFRCLAGLLRLRGSGDAGGSSKGSSGGDGGGGGGKDGGTIMWKSGELVCSDGARLAYKEALGGGSSGGAQTFVLLHDVGLSSRVWGECADLLAAKARVVTLDHRSHGLSSGVDRGMRISRLSADVDNMIASLEPPPPKGSVTLVAHGMSACVAWAYVESFGGSGAVGRIVVVDQTPMMARRFDSRCHSQVLSDPRSVSRMTALLSSALPVAAHQHITSPGVGGDPPPRLAVEEMAKCCGPAVARLVEDFSQQDWRDACVPVDVAVQVVRGSNSAILSEEAAAFFTSSGARVEAFDGSSHFPFLDYPQRFASLLLDPLLPPAASGTDGKVLPRRIERASVEGAPPPPPYSPSMHESRKRPAPAEWGEGPPNSAAAGGAGQGHHPGGARGGPKIGLVGGAAVEAGGGGAPEWGQPGPRSSIKKVLIGLDHAPPTFNVASRILGPQGVNVKHVSREFSVSCILRGHGTRDAMKQGDPSEPMHLEIRGQREEDVDRAIKLVHDLIATVAADLEAHKPSNYARPLHSHSHPHPQQPHQQQHQQQQPSAPSPVERPGAHSPDSWGGHGSGDARNGVYSPQKASTESSRGGGVANEAVGGDTPPAHKEGRALPDRVARDFSVVGPGAQEGGGDSPPPPPSPPPGSPPGN